MEKKEALPITVTVTKLMSCNRARLALLSEAQQAVARQGATERFWEDRDWQWLYNAYRVPIEQAAASAAGWDALPRGILPRQLEVCLAQALDALDEGKLTVPSPDGEPPVVMGLFGPIGRSESAPPAVEPLQAHTPSVARLPPPLFHGLLGLHAAHGAVALRSVGRQTCQQSLRHGSQLRTLSAAHACTGLAKRQEGRCTERLGRANMRQRKICMYL